MGEEQWYTNKELFEMLNNMREEFKDLSAEMRETRAIIRKYNGLREEVGECRKEVESVKEQMDVLKAKADGRSSVWNDIRGWVGVFLAFLGGGGFLGVIEFLLKK